MSTPGVGAATSRTMAWLIAVAGMGMAVYLALAWCVRPQADDWVWALRTRDLGWYGAQAWTWRHGDGHFVATFLQTALGLGDLRWTCAVVAVVIVAMFVASALLFARALAPQAPRAASAIALAGCFGASASTINREGFYWYSAAVTYPLPWGLVLFAAVCAIHGDRPGAARGWAIAGGMACLLAAGCGETLVPAGALLLAWGWWSGLTRRWAWWACAGGLAIGTAILMSAPSNAERLAGLGGMHPIPDAVGLAIRTAVDAAASITGSTVAVAVAALCAPLAAAVAPLMPWWRIAAMVAMAVVGAGMIGLPVMLGYGYMVDRVLNVMEWWLWLWGLAAWCAACVRVAAFFANRRQSAQRCAGAVAGLAVLMCLWSVAAGAGHWGAWAVVALAASAFAPIGTGAGPAGGKRVGVVVTSVLLALFAGSGLADAGPDLVMRAPQWLAVWHQRDAAMRAARARGERLAVMPGLPDDGYPGNLVLAELNGNPRYYWALKMADDNGIEEVWLDPRLAADNPLRAHWLRQVQARARQLGQTTLGGQALPP